MKKDTIIDKTRAEILELCSESEYGSWEFWLTQERTEIECNHIVQTIVDLVKEKKIFPMEYKSVLDQSYKETQLDINRLKNEIKRSMHPNNIDDPNNFYWFLATDEGKKEDFEVQSRKFPKE